MGRYTGGVRRSRHRRLATVATVVALVLAAPAGVATAKWFAQGSVSGGARADSLGAGNAPTAAVYGQRVTLTWTASTLVANAGHPATAYVVTRYGEGDTVGTGGTVVTCLAPLAITVCTDDAVTPGTWRYTVTPTLHDWHGEESPASNEVVVTLAAITVPPGQTLNATGRILAGVTLSQFRGNESVELWVVDGGGAHVGAAPASTVTVDADGNAAAMPVTVPVDIADGTYALQAVGAASGPVTPSATFVLDTTAPTTSAGSLAAWVRPGAVVHLAATDPAPGAVASISYRLGGAAAVVVPAAQADVTVTVTAALEFFATDAAGNAETEQTANVQVDSVAPVPGVVGVPTAIRNAATIGSSPTDAGSGVATVAYLYCPAAVCTPTIPIGDPVGAPFTVRWSDMAEGEYRVAALVTDAVGNTATSASVLVNVSVGADTGGPLGFLSPLSRPGVIPAVIGRTVNLSATATDDSGMADVRFEYRAGTGPWTPIATVDVMDEPDVFATVWDASALTPGIYTVRAIARDQAGNESTFAARRAVLYGPSDLQLVNGGGAGGVGKLELGDSVRITFDTLPRRTDMCPGGWNSGFVPIAGVRVTLVDGGSGPDQMTFTVPGCVGGGNLGTITLGSGDYVGAAGATFGTTEPAGTSRLAFEPATNSVVFTLGSLSEGSVTAVTAPTVAVYTPSVLALSANLSAPAGTASTTAGAVVF